MGEECGLENGLVSMLDQIVFGHSLYKASVLHFQASQAMSHTHLQWKMSPTAVCSKLLKLVGVVSQGVLPHLPNQCYELKIQFCVK